MDRRWLAFGSCVLAGLSNEVSGGALSLSLRPAGAELQATAAAMQLVMALSIAGARRSRKKGALQR